MSMSTDTTHIERLLWSWPGVVRAASAAGNDWAKGFAASIARQSRNPRWRPSPKQVALMETMVAETYRFNAGEVHVIEDD